MPICGNRQNHVFLPFQFDEFETTGNSGARVAGRIVQRTGPANAELAAIHLRS